MRISEGSGPTPSSPAAQTSIAAEAAKIEAPLAQFNADSVQAKAALGTEAPAEISIDGIEVDPDAKEKLGEQLSEQLQKGEHHAYGSRYNQGSYQGRARG